MNLGASRINAYAITPSINLGAIQPNSLTLDFDNSFRPEDPGQTNQRGEVDVSYDGGTTWLNILDLNTVESGGVGSRLRTNEHQNVNAFNPAGATTAQFRFGYLDAGNDWRWAIDNVRATGRTPNAGAAQTAINFTQPAHGTVTGTSTAGAFTYTPTAGYRDIDTFTYQPRDGVNTGNVTTVTVLVGTQAAVQVDDGTAQRSMVRSATVYFSSPPTFSTGIAPGDNSTAFTPLSLTGPGGAAVPFTVLSVDTVGSLTAVRIGAFSGALTQNGSLLDGRYTLTAVSSQITVGGAALDGDTNGAPGGDSVNQFHRFYGDVDGNARIDISDFGFFSLAYLTPANYNPVLDFNVDGRIDISDFGQSAFGTSRRCRDAAIVNLKNPGAARHTRAALFRLVSRRNACAFLVDLPDDCFAGATGVNFG